MTRLLVLLLAASLTGCGTSAAPAARAHTAPTPERVGEAPSLEGRALTLRERNKIEPLLRAAQDIRGLRFLHEVPMQVQTSASIRHSMESELEEEDLLKNRNFYVALGLLPEDVDVRELLLDVLGEQVVGYYDTTRRRLTLRDDVMSQSFAFGGSRNVSMDSPAMVIVHELVHALQDQNLNLSEADEVDRTDDASNAFHSVVEGDATLAMIAHLTQRSGVPLRMLATQVPMMRQALATQTQSAAPGSEALMHAPPIVRVPLLSAYVDGLLFCLTIYGERGGWDAVNAAHRTPPVSTEQVLHPEKYLANELPDTIVIPELPEVTAAGWRTVMDDTVGELEMSVYFGLANHEDTNPRAAAGWGGDRVRILQNDEGKLAAIWFTSWDTEQEAIEAHAAATAVHTRPETSVLTHVERRTGRAVLITRNLPANLYMPAIQRAFDTFADQLPTR